MRHWRTRGFAALAIILLLLAGSDEPYGNDKVYLAAHNYQFNFLGWEIKNFPQKWLALVTGRFTERLTQKEEDALVSRYFALTKESAGLTRQIRASPHLKAEQEDRLKALGEQRGDLRPKIEGIIEDRLTQVLVSQNLAVASPAGPVLFPPVDFLLESPPKLLVVSPRDRIEMTRSAFLRSQLTFQEMEQMEKTIESQNLSVLVDDTGGVSSYPSVIPETTSLRFLLSTIAHEWLHHYFFFQPLGIRYWQGYEMATINETAADIAGEELGDLLLEKYGPAWGEEGDGLRLQPGGSQAQPSPFQLEMRQVRLRVDQLLAAVKIEEAEKYMEEARISLAEKGYYIRKLNQAYFAFHGSYATSPASSSPIGGELRQLRERSGSVGSFVRRVSAITSPDQLRKLLQH